MTSAACVSAIALVASTQPTSSNVSAPSSAWTRATSAFRTSRRGRTVSPSPSSALSSRTLRGWSGTLGRPFPRLNAVAIASDNQLLPSPGCPR